MWTTIDNGKTIINLDNVAEIYRGYEPDTYLGETEVYLGIRFVGDEDYLDLKFKTKEELDQEFDRLERLLLNERSY